jgi:hypothetical protein
MEGSYLRKVISTENDNNLYSYFKDARMQNYSNYAIAYLSILSTFYSTIN